MRPDPCALTPQASLRKKEAELELVAPYSRSYGRTLVASVLESESQGLSLVRLRAGGFQPPWAAICLQK